MGHARGESGDIGLFGPQTVTWRVNREGVLLLGGGTALILQVAHPLVAAGVSHYSNYREDPWGRLYRTLDKTTRIVFGDRDDAARASAQIVAAHKRVHGTTTEAGGRYPEGTPYDANDPELLRWVWATLVDTSLRVYTRFVAPLSISERIAYYEEQKILADAFKVPADVVPADYAAFNRYMEGMLASDELGLTPTLADVTDAIRNPPLPFVARPAVELINLSTVGLLPPRLRAELDLPWGPTRERLFSAKRLALRALITALPGLLREFPPARTADRRVRAA